MYRNCRERTMPVRRRRTTAVIGLALVLSLPAGVAAAASPQSSPRTPVPAVRSGPAAPDAGAPGLGGLPSAVVGTVCAQWDRLAAAVPVPVEPPQVCKLVNGWD